MKVFLGKYRNWVGPYQIADWLQKVGVSEDRCNAIGEYLSETPLDSLCEWLYTKRQRKTKVKIHYYDHWNAYHTIALVTLPILKQLKAHKQGAGFVDDEDVPKGFKSTDAPPKENEWDSDANIFKRYDWVLDEMIFAFENIVDDSWEDQFHTGVIDFKFVDMKDGSGNSEMVEGPDHSHVLDMEGYKAFQARIANGTRLFGKYFQTLWD